MLKSKEIAFLGSSEKKYEDSLPVPTTLSEKRRIIVYKPFLASVGHIYAKTGTDAWKSFDSAGAR